MAPSMCRFENTQGGNWNGKCIVVKYITLPTFFVYIRDIPDSVRILMLNYQEKRDALEELKTAKFHEICRLGLRDNEKVQHRTRP
jgi:hypothetical protein